MGYLTPADAVERKWHSVVASLDGRHDHDKITISFVSANGAVVPPRLLTDILILGYSRRRHVAKAAQRRAAA